MLGGMKNIAFLLPGGANIASLETARHGFLVANEYLAAVSYTHLTLPTKA